MEIEEGKLIVFFAFDIGYEINLDGIPELVRTEAASPLAKKKISPGYIQIQGIPKIVSLGIVKLEVDGQELTAEVSAKIYDFGAVSLSYVIRLKKSLEEVKKLARNLIIHGTVEKEAKKEVKRLFDHVSPAVVKPGLNELLEDYYVFQVSRFSPSISANQLLEQYGGILASTLRFEEELLSQDEMRDALKYFISYYETDLVLTDWNAAFLFDTDYQDTLDIFEYMNVQLLEMRFADRKLDQYLNLLWGEVYSPKRYITSLFNPYKKPIIILSELTAETSILFERVDNHIKLIGDTYLARICDQISSRFHLNSWKRSVDNKVKVIEKIHNILNSRVATTRSEFLELIIILLIALEILLLVLGWA